MAWITPVTTRAADAQYTYTDLNRVGQDVQYLADLLNSYGYAVSVSTKTDWAVGDKPRAEQAATYLANVNALKNAFYGSISLPSDINSLSVAKANAIEQQLIQIEDFLTKLPLGFSYSNEVYCGEV